MANLPSAVTGTSLYVGLVWLAGQWSAVCDPTAALNPDEKFKNIIISREYASLGQYNIADILWV